MKKLPVVAGVATALVGLSVPVVLMLTDSADALTGRLADDDTERTVVVRSGPGRAERRQGRQPLRGRR